VEDGDLVVAEAFEHLAQLGEQRGTAHVSSFAVAGFESFGSTAGRLHGGGEGVGRGGSSLIDGHGPTSDHSKSRGRITVPPACPRRAR
jgi:hypothetical protein